MRFNGPWAKRATGATATAIVRTLMASLDKRAALYDMASMPGSPLCNRPKIIVLWHEYIPMGIYLHANTDITMLVTQHGDGDVLTEVGTRLGYDFVRGSTFRGGATALREMVRRMGLKSLGITPDGPRGPRRVFSQGAIYLASKLQMPLVAMGFGYDRPWRLSTWDQFAIPRPFSRARMVYSPVIDLPPDLDRKGIAHYRQKMEDMLNLVTCEAEAWAASRTSKVQQLRIRRRITPLRHRRVPDAPQPQPLRKAA